MKTVNHFDQWDKFAEIYDQGIGDSGDALHWKLIDPIIFRFLGDSQRKSILDAGCGNGYLLTKLSHISRMVTGTDNSSKLVEIARKRTKHLKNVTLIKTDLVDSLPFLHHAFDSVIISMVLQYLPELATFTVEAKEVLKINGTLIVIIDHPAHLLFLRAQELAGIKKEKFLSSGSYFTSGERTKKSLWDKAILSYYHRPLKEYFNIFTPYFRLEAFEEVTEDGEMPRIAGFKWVKK